MQPSLAEEFNENGFIGPFRVYEPDLAASLWKRIQGKLLLAPSKVYKHNPYNYDRHLDIDELSQHICHPEIVSRLEAIMGLGILCWRTEVFSKKPGASGTEWHQVENFAYANKGIAQLEPQSFNPWGVVITVWTAWTPANSNTSCMKFIPGSQKNSYFDESVPLEPRSESSFYGYQFADLKRQSDWQPDESRSVVMEMQPGEAVIFTTMCLHGSTANQTKDATRFSTNARYVKCDTRIFPNMSKVSDHEVEYDLANYSPVLVSGPDSHGLNKCSSSNLNGFKFGTASSPLRAQKDLSAGN